MSGKFRGPPLACLRLADLPTKFSKTDHLANTITQVQQIQKGVGLVKDNLMF